MHENYTITINRIQLICTCISVANIYNIQCTCRFKYDKYTVKCVKQQNAFNLGTRYWDLIIPQIKKNTKCNNAYTIMCTTNTLCIYL